MSLGHIKDTYFTESDLLHQRGWTAKAITTLLGAPDIASGKGKRKCYLVERVKAAEQTEFYRHQADIRLQPEESGNARGADGDGDAGDAPHRDSVD